MAEEQQKTILVVDDEPDILASVVRLLRKDYRVLTAETPDEARALLQREPVHVALSDQRMPMETGVQFLTTLREEHPDIIRVLLTGYANIDDVIDAINEGHVYRYVSKPWDPQEFKIIVSQCIERWESKRNEERLIEELREANEKLAEQNRALSAHNEALKSLDRIKSVFMEVVSHELNTPVAIILGYSYLLRREFDETENGILDKAIRGIGSSGERLKSISSRIFKMISTEVPSPESLQEVELREFFEGLREKVSPFLEKREQELAISFDDGDTVLLGDRAKLLDVFLNLVMNAIKFSYDGATIEIEVAPGDEEVVVVVKDAGIGINSEDLAQIFDAFFSTFDSLHHSSGAFEFGKRGIGLGLSVARRFVEMHGGTISVESTQPGGSEFTVRLPRRPER